MSSYTQFCQMIQDIVRNIRSDQVEINESNLKMFQNKIAKILIQFDVNIHRIKCFNQILYEKMNLKQCKLNDINKRLEMIIMSELQNLFDSNEPCYEPIRDGTNIILIMGLPGTGKSVSTTKLAHYYQRKGWKVGTIYVSSVKPAIYEQYQNLTKRVKVPYYVESNPDKFEPIQIAQNGIKQFIEQKFEIILIEYVASKYVQYQQLFNDMEQTANILKPDEIMLVTDSCLGQSVHDMISNYSKYCDRIDEYLQKESYKIFETNTYQNNHRIYASVCNELLLYGFIRRIEKSLTSWSVIPDGIVAICKEFYVYHRKIGSIILTKMDASAKGIGALCTIATLQKNISFLGIGEYMRDFEMFIPANFVKKCLPGPPFQCSLRHNKDPKVDRLAQVLQPEQLQRLGGVDGLNSLMNIMNNESVQKTMKNRNEQNRKRRKKRRR